MENSITAQYLLLFLRRLRDSKVIKESTGIGKVLQTLSGQDVGKGGGEKSPEVESDGSQDQEFPSLPEQGKDKKLLSGQGKAKKPDDASLQWPYGPRGATHPYADVQSQEQFPPIEKEEIAQEEEASSDSGNNPPKAKSVGKPLSKKLAETALEIARRTN